MQHLTPRQEHALGDWQAGIIEPTLLTGPLIDNLVLAWPHVRGLLILEALGTGGAEWGQKNPDVPLTEFAQEADKDLLRLARVFTCFARIFNHGKSGGNTLPSEYGAVVASLALLYRLTGNDELAELTFATARRIAPDDSMVQAEQVDSLIGWVQDALD